MPPLLGLTLALSLLWGYGQFKARQDLETRLDLQYQQAFYSLNWHMESLQNETAKILASNSPERFHDSSGIIWREANSASDSIGQLPLRAGSMAKTGNFLTQTSAFTNFIADRKISTGKISNSQWQTMNKIHNKIKSINTELKKIQSNLGDNSTNWRTLESAIARSTDQIPQSVLYKSFDGIEKQMDKNKILDFAEQFPDPMVTPKHLTGTKISRAQALRIARNFLEPSQLKNKVVRNNGQGNGTIATFGVEAVDRSVRGRGKIHLDISKRGGNVLWMLNERPVGAVSLSKDKVEARARQFLKRHGYESMALTSTVPYDGVTIFSFVYSQDNVLIYPDMIKLAVARDNGEVTQFDAGNYLVFHHDRTLPKPKVSFSQARAKLNPHLVVEQEKLSLILNEERKETFCYEFRGRVGNENVVVFINAETGNEEFIQTVTKPSENSLRTGTFPQEIQW